MGPIPHVESVEWILIGAVGWLSLFVEAIGVIIIGIGIFGVSYQFLLTLISRYQSPGFYQIRVTLGRYLALALEFQLGADILSTAIAPSWDEIGKLGAIAVIRTGLNLFLMHEMEKEKKLAEEGIVEAERLKS